MVVNLRGSQRTVMYTNVQDSYTFTVQVTGNFIVIKVDNFSTNCETTNISTHESWPRLGSGRYSAASHPEATVSIPVQFLCYL